MTAVNHNDIPGQVAVFTDNAVVIGGPCGGPPANGECVGKAQIQQAMQSGGSVTVTLSDVQVLGDGNTVTFKTNEAFPLPPEVTATGLHRIVELGTAVVDNGKVDRLALVPDVTDAQTVALQRLFAQMDASGNSSATNSSGTSDSTITSDGQSLATQPAATQEQFRAVYGDQAAAAWAKQHEATLKK